MCDPHTTAGSSDPGMCAAEADACLMEAELRDALNRIVRDSLKPLTAGIAFVVIAAFISLQLFPSARGAGVLSTLHLLSAAIFWGCRWALQRQAVPLRWAHPLAALIAAIGLLLSLTTMYFLADPHQLIGLILLMISAGMLLLSTSWLLLLLAAAWLGWLMLIWLAPAWIFAGFMLLVTSILAIVIHLGRLRTFRKLETLRIQDHRQTTKLRHMEEELRRYSTALERMVVERTKRIDELEKQHAENEKLAATGRMAARIAHEINNPLGIIASAFTLVSRAVSPQHRHHHYIGKIEKEIGRIAQILRHMLALHRPQCEQPRAFRADKTISDILALMEPAARERRVRLALEADQARAEVVLPENMLRQAVYNLVLNAVEASPENSTVNIFAAIAAQSLQITILDHGHGISPEIAGHIFEPFFTSKNRALTGGLGLGLSICKGLVEGMNGEIHFESEPGNGTTFRLIIPLKTTPDFRQAEIRGPAGSPEPGSF